MGNVKENSFFSLVLHSSINKKGHFWSEIHVPHSMSAKYIFNPYTFLRWFIMKAK